MRVCRESGEFSMMIPEICGWELGVRGEEEEQEKKGEGKEKVDGNSP